MQGLKGFMKNIDESVLEIWFTENGTDCTERINLLIEQHDNYSQKIRADEHGKTAKRWMIYINIYYINNCLVLHRAMKTNDFTLFGYTLFQLSSVFFRINHHNMLDG